jgi:methylenetetrahydrofolate reductase (NADPH)
MTPSERLHAATVRAGDRSGDQAGHLNRVPTGREALAHALRTVGYEILPFRSTEEAVLAHVPRTVPLTITTTEAKGLAPTLDLARRLAGHGYDVAPHLAARLVRDRQQLADIVAQLRDAGIDGVFVIAGDAAEPVGGFPDSLSLLEALDAAGHHFRRIGIAGYPEGHGDIDQELIDRAIEAKARYATHVVTQLCFDAGTTTAWARRLRGRGVDLPVRVGLPGVVNRQKLMRISAGLGLGQSARFLRKQQSLLWRFFLPGGYRPDRLVERLARRLPEPGNGLQGFHLFTFNELERTESWRRAMLARAGEPT